MRPRRSETQWRKLIAEFEAGDWTQAEFCHAHDVSLGAFQNWLYKLRGSPTRERAAALVRVETPAFVCAPLELGLPSGIVLRFVPATDPVYLAALVAALNEPRC